MKKLDKRSFLLGAALGVVPIAVVVCAGLTSTRADAQRFFWNKRVAPVTAPAPVRFAEPTSDAACARPASTDASASAQAPATDAPSAAENAEIAEIAVAKSAGSTASPLADAAVKPEFPGSTAQWTRGFDNDWVAAEKERRAIKPIFNNKAIVDLEGSQKEGHTYGNYTKSDLVLWEKETERLVVEGSLIFHNADLLGSANGTSCDMCHPDAEGTHAETYPKYQVQLGRVALLRDMANWCLTQPCRGTAMSGDDPRMRALEAYMQAQRSGQPMKYGKH